MMLNRTSIGYRTCKFAWRQTSEIMVNVILGYEHKEMRIKLLNGLLQQFPSIGLPYAVL